MWTGIMKLLALVVLVGLVLVADRCIGFQSVIPRTHRLEAYATLVQDEVRSLRTLDSHFPFLVPKDVEAWKERADALRLHVQMSLGLWPLPERSPLNAVIHGRIEMGDYSVEKVYFDSFPGFFVTGNLYRSTKVSDAECPAILCPHGHYSNGRFYEAGADEIKRAIGNGEEAFESNARCPLQARCAHLARMGCTVFHYDMIGYADSQQIPASVAHDFSKQRPDENGADGWGFFSPRAEMHLQSIMGLQTWNSMRAIDFVQSLPEVDPFRIGVTGSSGGGTQSFILAALDNRVTASFPAVMVSTGMQGGCTCENCCNLRVGTGNVEIAALFAPKPMGLSAANDWTRSMPEEGFPQLKQLYQMLGKPENVYLTASTDFPHGFNQIARRVMYAWFDKHLHITGNDPDIAEVAKGNLAEDSPWCERENRFLSKAELTVWDESHPAPASGSSIEHSVNSHWSASQQQILSRDFDENQAAKRKFVRSLLCESDFDNPKRLKATSAEAVELEGMPEVRGMKVLLGFEVISPFLAISCQQVVENGPEINQAGLVVVTKAKAKEIVDNPPAILRQILKSGRLIIVFTGVGLLEPNQLAENGREAACYTLGYNRARLADAALALNGFLDNLPDGMPHVDIICLDSTAPVGILAAASCVAKIGTIVLRDDFRFESVDKLTDPNFLPGALSAGDVPGLLEFANPDRIIVVGKIREDLVAGFPDGDGRIVSFQTDEEAVLKLLEK